MDAIEDRVNTQSTVIWHVKKKKDLSNGFKEKDFDDVWDKLNRGYASYLPSRPSARPCLPPTANRPPPRANLAANRPPPNAAPPAAHRPTASRLRPTANRCAPLRRVLAGTCWSGAKTPRRATPRAWPPRRKSS